MTENYVTSPSKERVAFDLLEKIVFNEKPSDTDKNNREYWLTLYRQCWKTVNGYTLEQILKKD